MQRCSVGSEVADATHIVIVCHVLAIDGATEVVAAIDDILDPREAVLVAAAAIGLTADIHLGMAQDVGITGTSEGVIDTTVTQIDQGVAADVTLVTATIDIFRLGQVRNSIFV